MTRDEVLPGGSAFGDRFVALLGTPTGPGWISAEELCGSALPGVLAAIGTARGTDNSAVAGVLLVEQYSQRLVAPVLASLLRHGTLLAAAPPQVRALFVDGAVCRLAFADAPVPGADPDRALAALVAHLDTLAAAVAERTRAGERVLRGASANAVASSLLHLSWPCRDRAAHLVDARTWLERLPGWAPLVEVDARVVAGEPWMYVRRNTCCQAFRTSVNRVREQPYCSSCPVLPPETTEALFARATAAYAARHPHPPD